MNAPPKSLFNKTGIVTSVAKSDEIGKIAHLITGQVSLRALLKVMMRGARSQTSTLGLY